MNETETTPGGAQEETEKAEIETTFLCLKRQQRILPSLIIVFVAIYETCEALLKTSTRLHILHLSCLHVTHNLEYCRHELNETAISDADYLIQSAAAPYLIGCTALMNGPTIISTLILGSLSDRHGRKKVLLIALVGQILACASFSFSYIPGVGYMPGGTLCLLIGVLIYGICGKSTVFMMGASGYITDCSTKQQRTRLLSRLVGVGFIGNCIGYALSSLFSLFITFRWILVTVSGTAVVLFLGILIFVKETAVCASNYTGLGEEQHKMYGATVNTSGVRGKEVATSRGNLENTVLISPEKKRSNTVCFALVHIIHFASRNRGRCERVHIFVLLLCCFLNHMVKVGEADVMLLYVMGESVAWDERIYGAYLSANYIAMSIQLLAVYPLLERLFNLSDELCIIIGASVRMLTFIATGFTSMTWLLFVYGVVGSFGAFVTCAARSTLTKLTSDEEVGVVLALASFLEVLAATIGSSVFTEIFLASWQTFVGTVFLVLAGLQACILLSVVLLRCFESKIGEQSKD